MMEANPDKFQVISLSKQKSFGINIGNVNLKGEKCETTC